jgi:hypothetical protein
VHDLEPVGYGVVAVPAAGGPGCATALPAHALGRGHGEVT